MLELINQNAVRIVNIDVDRKSVDAAIRKVDESVTRSRESQGRIVNPRVGFEEYRIDWVLSCGNQLGLLT